MKLLEEIAPQKLDYNGEIKALADEYLKKKALPKRKETDALHVAYSTVHEMDALVSWNFQDLANLSRWKRIIEINFANGYNSLIELVTPLEVLGHDEKPI